MLKMPNSYLDQNGNMKIDTNENQAQINDDLKDIMVNDVPQEKQIFSPLRASENDLTLALLKNLNKTELQPSRRIL